MESNDNLVRKEIRKLRKKLREINKLERMGHLLNDDEKIKVTSKQTIRNELLRILSNKPTVSQDTIPTADLISEFDVDESDKESDNTSDLAPNTNDRAARGGANGESHKRQLEDRSPNDKSEGSDKRNKAQKRLKPAERQEDDAAAYKRSVQRMWRSSEFTVRSLEGHNEAISVVAADGNVIVSASYDTTVKVWNGDSGQETYSLRGHTGSVTCLILLTSEVGDELCRYLGLAKMQRVALTGSTDCSVILWSVTAGEKLKSIYTFNTITCLVYASSEICIITATEGGKIEIYDAVSGTNLRSLTMFDESYTCMTTLDQHLYAASSDGIIKIWEICDRDLVSKFTLEQLDDDNNIELVLRQIHCLVAYDDWVFYGDDGINIKAFNWKTKKIKKFCNHACESGSTDGIACNNREIISSSYNLDTAKGHVNVRSFPTGEYLCSLSDDNTGKINSLASTTTGNGMLRIVTGGSELKIWDVVQLPRSNKRSKNRETIYKTTYIPYYTKDATASEYESSEVDDSDEGSDAENNKYEKTYIPREINERSSFWSSCVIL